jgi:hypothetical protein
MYRLHVLPLFVSKAYGTSLAGGGVACVFVGIDGLFPLFFVDTVYFET